MIAKMEIKCDTLDNLDAAVEEATEKYEEMAKTNFSATYTLTVNYTKKSLKIKILDIGVQVN